MQRIRFWWKRYFSFDPQQESLFDYFRSLRRPAQKNAPVVLIQCVEDIFQYGLFGQIVTSLQHIRVIRVEQYVLRSLNVGESSSVLSWLIARLVKNPLHTRKWRRLYSAISDSVAYRSTSLRPFADLFDFYSAWKTWCRLRNKDEFIALSINGVQVGDLINDSFIRFKPAPSVTLSDWYLLVCIWQAYRDARRAEDYFARARPKIYLTTYSAYVQHGIAVRVALRHGVRVFSFGEYQEFSKELSTADWFHTINPTPLAINFAKLSDQDARLAIAEGALAARLSGAIDRATIYMKRSAYAESTESVPDVRGALVVFLHDFYDSPYIYRGMIFPDFWEWVCFTIEVLTEAGFPVFLKPHPNQITLNDDVLAKLKSRYPHICIVSPKVTNLQLLNAGLSCAVTIYGSVANEMAYLGIPTIASAHHPHSSFEFCLTARDREEYAQYLRCYKDIEMDKAIMRRQSLMFYYMFNFGKGAEETQLTDAVTDFRIASTDSSKPNLVDCARRVIEIPAYKRHINRWVSMLS